jgi:hypothetical protein
MSALVQHIIVATMVVGATLFAIWRLAGSSARLRWLEALSRRTKASGFFGKLLTRQLEKRRAATGCGACSANSHKQK